MSQYSKLIIRDLMLEMFLGIYEHEKSAEQRVIVNIEAYIECINAGQTDDINHTVSYEEIVNAVTALSQTKEHTNLVESFAEKIAQFCLNYESVQEIVVRVEKPDIIANVESVGIEIKRVKSL